MFQQRHYGAKKSITRMNVVAVISKSVHEKPSGNANKKMHSFP